MSATGGALMVANAQIKTCRDGDKTGYRSQPLLELRVGSLLDPGVETVTKKR